MKKLITIILIAICLNGFGQNKTLLTSEYSVSPDSDTLWCYDPPIISVQDNYENYIKEQSEIRLLYLLTEYEADCYNDSTKVNVLIIENWSGKFRIIDDNDPFTHETGVVGREVDYIHKKPTFTGFIKWLQKRKTDH